MDEDVWLSEYLGVFLAGSATGIFYALFLRSGRSLERYRTWIEAAGWLAFGIVILRIPSVYTLLFRPAEEVNKLGGDLGILAALWSIFILAALLAMLNDLLMLDHDAVYPGEMATAPNVPSDVVVG